MEVFATNQFVPITELARAVEEAGLESLFLVQYTHLTVGRRDLLQRPQPPILVGSHGARGLRHVAEYGDEWSPVVTDELDLSGDLQELERLCQDAGRKPAGATVILVGPDEGAMERCAKAGVARYIVGLVPRWRNDVSAFLESCAPLARRFED